MKTLRILIFVLLTSLCLINIYGCSPDNNKTNIGVVLPLSGDAAVYGEMLDRGIKLALDQYSGPANIELHYEDSKGRPLDALSGYKALRQQYGIKCSLGFFSSSELLAAAPTANKDEVVLISPTASASSITNAGQYIFRIASSDAYDANVLAKFSATHLNLKKAAVVYINDDYGKGVFQSFDKDFSALGGTVVAAEGYSQDRKDFRTIILKIKHESPTITLIVGHAEMGLFLRQAQELQLNTPILSTGLIEDPRILEVAGGAANGVYYSMPSYDMDLDQQVVTAFEKAFERKYSKPSDIGGKLGFDLLNCILAGLENVQGDISKLREGLLAIKDFHGVTGSFHFDKNGDVIRTYGIKRIKNNAFTWELKRF